MKKKLNILTLLVLLGIGFVCVLGACKKPTYNTFVDQGIQAYSASANAAQLVVPRTSSGDATLTATYDANTTVFNYTVTWSKLDSTVTSIQIYGPNTAGQSNILLRTLTTYAAPLPTGASGTLQNAIFQLNALSASELSNLKSGNCYLVLNTTASPTGSVRGQIKYLQTSY